MNCILTHYHILCDPYLGLVICDTIIITYDFIEFSNAMGLPWETYFVPNYHPRFSSVKKSNVIKY